MNLDEQFSNNVDKQMLNQLWQENVISCQTENPRNESFWGFFI